MTPEDLKLLEKLFDVIEQDIIPLTEQGVANGNKVLEQHFSANRICLWSLLKPTMKPRIRCGMVKCIR